MTSDIPTVSITIQNKTRKIVLNLGPAYVSLFLLSFVLLAVAFALRMSQYGSELLNDTETAVMSSLDALRGHTPPPLNSSKPNELCKTAQKQQYAHLYGLPASSLPEGFVPFAKILRNSRDDKRAWGYGRMYAEYLDPLRLHQKTVNMLEIGVRGGNSLNLWLKAFPDGNIYGLEKFPEQLALWNIPEGKEEAAQRRVKVFQGDQANATRLSEVAGDIRAAVGLLDFIIDDGGHNMTQQMTSFTHLMPLVRPGGLYFIEDLQTSYWDRCQEVEGEEYCFGGGAPGTRNTTMELIKSMLDALNSDFITAAHKRLGDYKLGSGTYHVNPADQFVGSVQCWRNMCVFRRKYSDTML